MSRKAQLIALARSGGKAETLVLLPSLGFAAAVKLAEARVRARGL